MENNTGSALPGIAGSVATTLQSELEALQRDLITYHEAMKRAAQREILMRQLIDDMGTMLAQVPSWKVNIQWIAERELLLSRALPFLEPAANKEVSDHA